MWNKIYLIILAAAVFVSGILIYLAYNNLQSSGFAPATIVENYNYYADFGWMFLWISTALLLIAANAVLWKSRKTWALWATLIYFAVSVVLQKFWLAQSLFHFRKDNKFTDNILSLSPFLAITLIVLMAVIIFFNHYLVKRLHDKMYLPEQPVEALPEAIPVDENKV